ncbi:MAG: hypothetical protein RI957_1448 [Verrucomicrobiota bacterium]
MVRLKERGHDDGELVTRADGTVAIKVKKRKRRTKQPHKEKAKRTQRLRVLQLGLIFFLITTLLALATGMLFYYNSNSFRESTRQKVSEWSGADVEMAEFTVTPNSAKCASVNFTWPAGNYLRELQVSYPGARLDISSFLGNKWGGSTVVGKSGKLVFSNAVGDAPRKVGAPPSESAFPFAFSSYRCEKLQIVGLDADRTPWMTVEETEASLVKTTRGTQARFVGGLIKLGGFQPMRLDRGSVYFEQKQMRCENLRLRPITGNGALEMEKSLELYSPEKSQVQILLEEFPLEVLLGNELDVIFSGHVDTPTTQANRFFHVHVGDLKTLRLQIGFRGSERDGLTIRNLPFLAELSRELQNPEYARQYVFSDRVEGELIREHGESRIQSLRLEKKGCFVILGEVVAKDNQLGGTLQVGLPGTTLFDDEQHAALREIFTRREDGYLWCAVQLSGKPGQPQDNFAEQLQQAVTKISKDQPNKPPTKPATSIEDELKE